MRSDEAGYDDDLAQTIKMVAEWLALDKLRVVTFVRDPDGAVRGMTAHGDRQAGTIVRATIYEQEPRRFRQRHARLFLADDEHMRALQNLADTSENFGVEQWKDDVMTVAFRQDAGAFERCSEYSHPEHRAYARASPLVDISPTPVRRTLDRLRLIPGARKR